VACLNSHSAIHCGPTFIRTIQFQWEKQSVSLQQVIRRLPKASKKKR